MASKIDDILGNIDKMNNCPVPQCPSLPCGVLLTCQDCWRQALEEVRADAIDECINYLTDYFGVAEATKYGNKTREQQEISYSTRMNYEIKQGIEKLEGLKGKDTDVPATKEGEKNEM